jgi:hypothetical protein
MLFKEITKERLLLWEEKINSVDATPVLLLSIGHETFKGKVILCVTEDMPIEKIRQCLLIALSKLPN